MRIHYSDATLNNFQKEMGVNMKIILSRKGFDSSTGEARMASPIMPDGSLLSLPIPVTKAQAEKEEKGIPYSDLRLGKQNLDTIIEQLSNGKFKEEQQAHLDPDLDKERLLNRQDEHNWRQVFGQQGTAQTYLKNRDAGKKGDIFLFFGWFKQAKNDNNGNLKYVPRAKDLHVIFGWLQIGKIFKVGEKELDDWLKYHPHIVNADIPSYKKYNNNTIYIAAPKLNFDVLSDEDGGGVFPCFKKSLQLTAPKEELRSHWCLPRWLCENYIEGKWDCQGDCRAFDSNGRKQEFVFDVPKRNMKNAIKWLKGLFECCG